MCGDVYNRLEVKWEVKSIEGRRRWLCFCYKCVTYSAHDVLDLLAGRARCSYCHPKPVKPKKGRKAPIKDPVKRLYSIYGGMKQRCYNSNHPRYKIYGGLGVSICDNWLLPKRQGFFNFYNWAMSNGYKNHLTIDRYPHTDGNYEPGNCRWATWDEQAKNKRMCNGYK